MPQGSSINKWLLNKLILILQMMTISSERGTYLTKAIQLVRDLNLCVWL